MSQPNPPTHQPPHLDDEAGPPPRQTLFAASLTAALVLASLVVVPRIPVKFLFGYSDAHGWLAFAGFVGVGIGLTLLLNGVDLPRRFGERASIRTRLFGLLPAGLGAFVVGFAVWSFAFGCEVLLDVFVFEQPSFYAHWGTDNNIVAFRALFPAFIGGGARAAFVASRLFTAPMRNPWLTLMDLYCAFLGACTGAFVAAIIWTPWALLLLLSGIES